MITTADLKSQTRRDLAEMARQCSVTGWHGMRKQELIDALRKVQRQARRREKAKAANGPGSGGSTNNASPSNNTSSRKSTAAKRSQGSLSQSDRKNAGGKNTGSKKSAAAASSTAGTKTKRSGQSKTAAASAKRTSSRSNTPAAGKTASSQSGRTTARSDAKATRTNGSTAARKRKSASASSTEKPRKPVLSAEAKRKLRERQEILDRNKDLSASVLVGGVAAKGGVKDKRKSPHKDRAILIVRDSYWLQASWEVTRASVERARAALAEHWHSARPVLRLMSVVSDNAVGAAEQPIRDIPIHGGVNNWYIDVLDSPAKFRVVVGYASGKDRFYAICRSNIVETPPPGSCDAIDGHWQDIAEDYERIYALSGGHQQSEHSDLRELFEDRLHRTMAPPDQLGLGQGSEMALRRDRDLPFEVDAELIVYGSTTPGASVSLGGEPVKLRPDGTFTVRLELPDRRQVLPVVATSRDGMRQRTTVVAVERNTKVMEPYDREDGDA